MPEDTAPLLSQKQTKFIQEITRMFFYYAQVADIIMLTTLSALAMEQTKPTTKILQHAKQFLNYATSNSDTTSTYHARNMLLAIHSNASYFSKPKSCRRVGGTSSYLAIPHFPQTMAWYIIYCRFKSVMS